MLPLAIGMLILVGPRLAGAPASIRQVDFKNFTYPWSEDSDWPHQLEWKEASEGNTVRLVNGRWRLDPEDEEDSARFSGLTLESVGFTDVTDDGKEDAIVVLRFDTGGTQYSHYVYIYSFSARKPKLLALFHSGDRAYYGLYRVYGLRGELVVELFDPEKRSGDCCSSGFVRTRYRWRNDRFEALGGQEFGTPEEPSRLPVTIFGTHE